MVVQKYRMVPNVALVWTVSFVCLHWTALTFFSEWSFHCSGHGSTCCCHFLMGLCLLEAVGLAFHPGEPITAPVLPGHSYWSRVSTWLKLGQSESFLGILPTGVWREIPSFLGGSAGGRGRLELKPLARRNQCIVGGDTVIMEREDIVR